MDKNTLVSPILGGQEDGKAAKLAILYIEDFRPDYILLVKKLAAHREDIDFVVDQAFSLAEGLSKLDAKRTGEGTGYDLVLLDVSLPDAVGKSGYLRVSKDFPEVPVIMLSESSNPALAFELVQLGAQDYLLKDYVAIPELMIRSICNAIERKQRIDHEKALENQLIQAEKLDSLGLIAAGVAHEVKNPLAIIQMAIPYVQSIAKELNDPVFEEVCGDLENATEKAIRIIKGMVEFSRDDVMNPVPGTLDKPTLEALNLLSYEIKKSNTQVESEFDESSLLCIDEGKIEQVVINLVNNSIQAMTSSGVGDKQIHISTYTEDAETAKQRPGIKRWMGGSPAKQLGVLEILDNGPGVPVEKISKIFTPFYTTKPKGKGTGLGLSVVMKIVGLHDAYIQVENAEESSGLRTRVYFKALPDNPETTQETNE